jgi:hypothetical protein
MQHDVQASETPKIDENSPRGYMRRHDRDAHFNTAPP